jgi:small Trp-rich protein
LLAMKYFQIGFIADLSWWWVMSPFVLAAAWWWFADATGYTKRKQMEKMDDRVKDRLDRTRKGLGMKPTVKKK